MLSKLKIFYTNHRFVSNMGLYFVLYGAGDFSRQTILEAKQYNYGSILRMAIVGGFMHAPLHYNWYRILDRLVVGTSFRQVVKKIVMDQCFLAPVGMAVFYTGASILEGKEDIFAEVRAKGVKTVTSGLCYWPVVQVFNFRFVSPTFRVPYVACAAYIWTIVLSYFKHTHHEQYDENETPPVLGLT